MRQEAPGAPRAEQVPDGVDDPARVDAAGGASVPSSQVMGATPVQVPCEEATDTKLTRSSGSGSVTTTWVAVC